MSNRVVTAALLCFCAVFTSVAITTRVFFPVEKGTRGNNNATSIFDEGQASATAVIVAGAWTLPSGSLSRAFKNRVAAGARVALLTKSPILLLTGGHNESHTAKRYLLSMRNASSLIFPSALVDDEDDDHLTTEEKRDRGLPSSVKQYARRLRQEMDKFDTFGDFLSTTTLSIFAENMSTTTAENAKFAAEMLRELIAGGGRTSGGEGDAKPSTNPNVEDDGAACWCPECRFIVVSSYYHLLRCKILFYRHLAGSSVPEELQCNGAPSAAPRVLTYPSSSDEFELPFPSEEQDGVDVARKPKRMPDFEPNWLVPNALARLAHRVYFVYAHWRSHLRTTLLSMNWFMRFRESGAIMKSLLSGSFTHHELWTEMVGHEFPFWWWRLFLSLEDLLLPS